MQGAAEIGMAVIAVVISILIMSLLGNIKTSDNLEESKTAVAKAYIDNTVGVYLKHQVRIDNESYSMADLMIIGSSGGSQYLEALRTETDNFFSRTNMNLVHITIEEKDLMKKYYKKTPVDLGHFVRAKVGDFKDYKEAQQTIEFTLPGAVKAKIIATVII